MAHSRVPAVHGFFAAECTVLYREAPRSGSSGPRLSSGAVRGDEAAQLELANWSRWSESGRNRAEQSSMGARAGRAALHMTRTVSESSAVTDYPCAPPDVDYVKHTKPILFPSRVCRQSFGGRQEHRVALDDEPVEGGDGSPWNRLALVRSSRNGDSPSESAPGGPSTWAPESARDSMDLGVTATMSPSRKWLALGGATKLTCALWVVPGSAERERVFLPCGRFPEELHPTTVLNGHDEALAEQPRGEFRVGGFAPYSGLPVDAPPDPASVPLTARAMAPSSAQGQGGRRQRGGIRWPRHRRVACCR